MNNAAPARLCLGVLLAAGSLATASARKIDASLSPAAQLVQPFEAMRLGQGYVGAHPGTEFLVGSGNSMFPLYRDHAVIVARHTQARDLKAGMTAVFVGDSGRPVAHVLIRKTLDGWIAQGVNNSRPDEVRVTSDNLVGVVVAAYQPVVSPLVALIHEAASASALASIN